MSPNIFKPDQQIYSLFKSRVWHNGLYTCDIIELYIYIRIGDTSSDEVTEMSDESLTCLTDRCSTCEYLDGIEVQRVDLNAQEGS